MLNTHVSAVLRDRLRNFCADQVPGCTYYVTRNGEPFADGSFGWARLPGASVPALSMTAQTLMHTASVGKFICGVAILRWIEDWNLMFGQTIETLRGHRQLRPGVRVLPEDQALLASVLRHGQQLRLDTPMFSLIEPFLDHALINSYRARPSHNAFPGANVATVTIAQLLNHSSGVAFNPVSGQYQWPCPSTSESRTGKTWKANPQATH
jgi:CubicO group peptidase (beta-lactamase class C family)